MHGITNFTGLGREEAAEFLSGRSILNYGQILILPPSNGTEPEVYIGIGKTLALTPGLRGDTLLRLANLEDAFDGHQHPISDIIDLQLALDGKAALVHTHGMGDITGLVAALADKASITYVDAADAALNTAIGLRALTTDVNAALALKAADNAVLKIATNLNDLANKGTARTNLGVYSKAEVDSAVVTNNAFLLARANHTGTQEATTIVDATRGGATLKDLMDDPWWFMPIGVPIGILSGTVIPSNVKTYKYVRLTSGLTGVGQYNNGKLRSESVSGSSPLVLATAIVDLAASPLYNNTIDLVNTTRRVLRGGSQGTAENDQMQQITGRLALTNTTWAAVSGAFTANSFVADRSSGGGQSGTDAYFDSANSSNARTGSETRSKNVGVDYYMRIF